MNPSYTNLGDLQTDLLQGNLRMVDQVKYYLNRITDTQELNIYLEVYESDILTQAEALDRAIAAGEDLSSYPLFGLVLSVKDVIVQKGKAVSAGSKILAGYVSPFSSTAIERLIEAGALIIGRVNCDEFAMGSANENSAFGPTKNGLAAQHVPGGSSGASAVAVQMDTCLASLGSDTGGSVRQPAAFCGVLGYKPTYGRVSRHGLIAYGSSFDQIGILSHSIEDAERILEVMAGPDEMDATAIQQPLEERSSSNEKLKIAYWSSAVDHPGLDPEIQQVTQALIDRLRSEGHTVEAIDFDLLDYVVPTYYVLTTAEASTNLSRFDGIRYGHRSAEAENLEDVYLKSRTEGFGKEVKRRILLGTFVLSAGYFDAYYGQAQKVRRLIRTAMDKTFETYDVILSPVTPTTAWKIGEQVDDPIQNYLADIYTVSANLAGIPAMALPLGTHSNGLPFGVQFMAPFGADRALLQAVRQV